MYQDEPHTLGCLFGPSYVLWIIPLVVYVVLLGKERQTYGFTPETRKDGSGFKPFSPVPVPETGYSITRTLTDFNVTTLFTHIILLTWGLTSYKVTNKSTKLYTVGHHLSTEIRPYT